jgi:5-methyltetrahydrofolate--homocysteine methyltransferase
MSNSLLGTLRDRPLLGDGAMGTQLQEAGLESGGCGEAWNLDEPDRVVAIQRRYVEAGSDCLITNTFGGSRIMLERHTANPDVVGINKAAVEVARRAFGDRDGFVLGDIGPFGGLMEPYGEITRAEVDRAFAEQAKALVEAGADAIIVETQTVLDEAGAAIAAAKAAGAPCVIASMAFDFTHETRELRTMMGTDPDEAAAFLEAAGADVLGLNCGTNIDMARALAAVQRYRECSALPIMAQPNAGQPVLQNLKVVYNQAPEEMAAQAGDMLEAGVAILGACCGSTPAHIAGLRGRMNQFIETQPQIG